MFKVLISLLFMLLHATDDFSSENSVTATSTCPEVSNLHKTFETSNSFACAWNAANGATEYKLWYSRQEDNFTSGYFYTTNVAYTFTGLTTGRYTFYVATVCGTETSGWVVVEDDIQG